MLDIIHTENSIENIEPPFGSIDFECNSIILTSDDTYKLSNVLTKNFTPKKKIEKMNQIMTNILRKETTIVYADLPEFRITKLLKYGWTINSENVKIFKEITISKAKTETNRQCSCACRWKKQISISTITFST